VDPWVASHGYAALALWLLGFMDQSARASEEAVAYARELGHPLSIAFSLHFGASLFIARREPRAVEPRAEALIALSSDLGLAFWGNQGTMARGQALIQRGHSAEGLAQVQGVLDTWSTLGKALNRPNYLAAMAEAYAAMGQVERGIDILDATLAEIVRTGERWWESELHRLKGDLILKCRSVGGQPTPQGFAQAEACMKQAVEVARRQGARSLELRAAVSLSRLWLSQGERERGHELLKETYSWFTEGFDTADLQDARAVLTSCEALEERGAAAAQPRSKARGAIKPDPSRNPSRRRSSR
jgi:predicted ATPase